MSKPYPKVVVTDETMRDGLQIERAGVTLEEKVELLNLLVAAGLRRIVVGAFVNAKWSPQMADTLALVERLQPRAGVQFFALALNERGREMVRTHSATLSTDPTPMTALQMCEVFMRRNTNRTLADQEATWRLPIEKALAAGVRQAGIALSEPWGSNWAGAVSHETRMAALQRQHDAWNAAGITVSRVALFDPMSWNQPHLVAEDLREIKERWPSVREFHLHMHNGRGMAMVSAYAALSVLDAEDTLFIDTAVGGIGGCPYCGNGQATGMIPTEDFVQLLQTLNIESDIALPGLVEANHRLSEILGRRLSSQVSLVGPLPRADSLYDDDIPVIYTFDEAQHFRLGPSVFASDARPWADLKKQPG